MSWLRKGLANSGSCFVPARRAGPQVEKLSPFGTLIHARPPETTIDSLDTSSCLRLYTVIDVCDLADCGCRKKSFGGHDVIDRLTQSARRVST